MEIHTFGCKVNTYDSGLLQKRLEKTPGRVHVLNTCAVTAEATREAVRTIRKLKSRDPHCTVVVTGCAAQVDTGVFAELEGADLVVANSHKGQLEELLKRHLRGELGEKVFKSNIFRKEDLEEGGGLEAQHTRAFLKIQDGCNSFCTFCIIPFARGKSRSIPVRSLVERVRDLCNQGFVEVVLTGVHIGDYEDEGQGLEDLIEAVLESTPVSRLRLSSLEPIELSERLLQLHLHPRLCAHFHMSIQSATTKVLSEMRRKYTAQDVERALSRIAEIVPNAFVGMDVIAGFTGESEPEFKETLERLRSLPWTRLHVFPYSERDGTKAALRTDQVDVGERRERARQLRELSSARYAEKAISQIGQPHQVLLLREQGSLIKGVSRQYWPVVFEARPELQGLQGREIAARITGFDPHSVASRLDAPLYGEWAGGL